MKQIAAIFLLAGIVQTGARAADVELKPNITDVTVYTLGAGVTHNLNVDLKPGQNTLLIRGVSQFVSESSIQINRDDITVINAKLIKKLTPREVQNLMDEKESCTMQLQALNAIIKSEKLEAQGIAEIVEYYDSKSRVLRHRLLDIDEKLKEDQQNPGEAYPKVLVINASNVNGSIQLKYVVGSAAWVTSHEILVPDSNSKMKLRYIARVMNRTGEDWNNVNLSLSLSSPFDKNGEIPEMQPVYLGGYPSYENDYEEQQQTQDILNTENLKALKIEGVEYETFDAPAYTDLLKIEQRVTVPANGGIYSFEVFTKELNNSYVWYAFPGIEKHPFLIARVADWNTLPIVDGEAKVYLKGASIGESYISIAGFPDTLEIPIAQNQEVLVERTEIGNESVSKTTGNKVRETSAFSNAVKSNSGLPLTVRVFDQIPVSQSNHQEVTANEQSGGELEDETGFITWDIALKERQETKDFKLSYTVEYTKGKVSFGRGRSQAFSANYSYVSDKRVRAKF
jgi:uncharacterized protein (TIGR02231 family)